ncbi:hypothetical protein [Listeria seeligeri]|uniref:hypothetical protein n=1 Tax=Listeria seeligeri TaxID=1640 RepID=UPI00188951DC|nr:hypothetical protein [Listeria seeligeri]MBF2564646.1 hypothetical protein [Listeria seeligeri]
MMEWIITCNPEFYKVEEAYANENILDWRQSNNIEIGDIVFIYVAAPIKAILFETKVVAIDKLTSTIDDSDFIIVGDNYVGKDRYMELELVKTFSKELLNYEFLKDNGLGTVRGSSIVNDELHSAISNATVNQSRITPKSSNP